MSTPGRPPLLMDPNHAVSLLLAHLAETTIERDRARAEMAKARAELDALQERLAEIEAQIANPDPVRG